MSKIKQLGNKTKFPNNPNEAILEIVNNPHGDELYVARFSAPEFTSLCPVTGQPDFANIIIDYIPNKFLLESKSFKLFMQSFRNHGAFHEDVTLCIAKRIVKEVKPIWLRIGGYFYPRGGIPIDVFWQTDLPPKKVWIPEINIKIYSGRN
jgi:7-cyano-7-deazaguanine reductase